MKEIDEERAKIMKQQQQQLQQQPQQIMMQRPGEPPTLLSNEQIIQIIQEQTVTIGQLNAKIGELDKMICLLQKEISEKNAEIVVLQTQTIVEPETQPIVEPEIQPIVEPTFLSKRYSKIEPEIPIHIVGD
jgi:hypothetical protein